MKTEDQLCIAIASLMEALETDSFELTTKHFNELRDSDKYVGIKMYKEGEKIIIKRTKKEDLTTKDVLDAILKKLKEQLDD